MKLDTITKHLTLQEKQKYLKNKTCFFYRKTGHIIRNCCLKFKGRNTFTV